MLPSFLQTFTLKNTQEYRLLIPQMLKRYPDITYNSLKRNTFDGSVGDTANTIKHNRDAIHIIIEKTEVNS